MTRHRSTAYVGAAANRGPSPQFRFIIRLAIACHARGVPYDLTWAMREGKMAATITAAGDIPLAKPLPKAPRLRPVADWRPTIWEAVYSLGAYMDSNLDRPRPGFVIAHSCGLSLVHPSDDGELGGDGSDIRQNWLITHAASGRGFGLSISFKRATDALLLAASFAVDWTQDVAVLKTNPEFRRAGDTVIATYGAAADRESAKRRLERAA